MRRLFVAAPLLLLLLGEIGARVLANEWSQFNLFIGAHREFDPTRKVRLRANYGAAGIRINSRGFMGPEFEAKQAPGSYRIVVLGDSCSFAPTARPWPRVMEEALRERFPERGIEVILAACGGYSSVQARQWYASEVVDYEHDLVVAYLGWNDMGQYGPQGLEFKLEEEGYLEEPSWVQRALVDVFLLRSIHVVQGYMERRKPVSLRPMSAEVEALYADHHPVHFEDNLRAIVDLAQSRGRPVYLLNYAGLVVDAPTEDEQRRMHFPRGIGRSVPAYMRLMEIYEGVLAQVSEETGSPLLDIKSLFPTPRQREVFTDSCHFDRRGAEAIGRFVAEAVAGDLREAGD